jgi:YihY family inner membrane protein
MDPGLIFTRVIYVSRLAVPIKCIQLLVARVLRDGVLKSASALTYQSFLAIVPLLAVLFGIAKGFGLEQILDNWLKKEFSDHQEVLTYLLQFSQSTLKEAQGGVIAGVGVILLLFTAIRLLSSVESTLNSMWGIKKGRPPLRKVSDYLALLLTCPVLLAISGSATIFITAQFVSLTQMIGLSDGAQAFLLRALTLLPFATSTFLFTVLLFSMPCAPVRIRSALITGFLAAVAFQFVQSWYILFQLRLTKVSAVYGSFVALPLFLVWLWISWCLFLVAGELLVFFQEQAWKSRILGYTDSPIEQLDTDVAVLSYTIKRFDLGIPVTLPDLFKVAPCPMKALTASVERLECRGYILRGWSAGYSTAIVPSRSAFTASLSDITLPAIPQTYEASSRVVEAVRAWTMTLRSDPFSVPVSQLS